MRHVRRASRRCWRDRRSRCDCPRFCGDPERIAPQTLPAADPERAADALHIMLTLVDVLRARLRIAAHVRRTPLVTSAWLSAAASATIALKLESLQVSNSFKSRGAFNAVIARLERGGGRLTRLVTASAGNHGRALAAAAETFGLPLTVFTPADAPQAKVAAIRRHGAELRADALDYDDAERLAKAFAKKTGGEFISPYNDADVIAGAATIALEIVEDAPATN